MNRIKKTLLVLFFVLMVVSLIEAADQKPVADEIIGSSGINWLPKINFDQLILTVSRPDGSVFRRTYESGSSPHLDLSSIAGSNFCEGSYAYELRVIPLNSKKIHDELMSEREKSKDGSLEARQPLPALTQTGYFSVRGGAIVTPSGSVEGQNKNLSRQEATYNEDLYVKGSLCVGTDCSDPETWGDNVLRLKESNLRVHFDDTSATSAFPANDWSIVLNDTADGGANYFAVEDTSAGVVPFKIEAGAPANSLYVEDYGRIGLKTSAPSVELHIVDEDSPALRLEQDASSGFSAQAWDIAGNESNFFVRDVTNSSKLPFRIQPNTPSSTLCLKSDGKIGVGTWSPTAQFDIEKTGENAAIVFNRTDGAMGKFTARPTEVYMGSGSNHPIRIVANNTAVLTVTPTGYVGVGQTSPTHKLDVGTSGAYCNGGAWVDGSSRKVKNNIRDLTTGEAEEALNGLNPVKFNYKEDDTEENLGFIAEDVPELVATKDRKGMSPMDIVAVLTKVVQEQQKTIAELQKKIEKLEQK